MGVFLYPAARKDIFDIAKYIAQDKPGVASDFIDEFYRTCDLFVDMPEIGTRVTQDYAKINKLLKDARRFPMKRFSDVLIFYKKMGDDIVIIRVVSSRRNLKLLFSL